MPPPPPRPRPPGCAAAVRSAVAGDEAAFARIVEAYCADLFRVAYVVAGDQALAEDAAQAAWSIAWRKLPSLRDPERLRPWLVSVAANEARQLLRSQHRRQVAEIRVRPPDDPPGDPSAVAERLDLLAAFRHLKPEDRSLLAMRYVAGLDAAVQTKHYVTSKGKINKGLEKPSAYCGESSKRVIRLS